VIERRAAADGQLPVRRIHDARALGHAGEARTSQSRAPCPTSAPTDCAHRASDWNASCSSGS
jgi:hypothetical protein